jgi:tartrate dehydrogenase/decarboxylase/D-malate dehydrogenase
MPSDVTTTRTMQIAVIPGDGIGPEVIGEACRILQWISQEDDRLKIELTHFEWGSEYYLDHEMMMAADGLEQLSSFDAIFLGAIGDPRVPDEITLWGLLLPIRQHFEQYVNLRPIRLLPGVSTPLAGRRPGDIDMVIVRENSEGEYAGKGVFLNEGTPEAMAIQFAIFSRKGVERVLRYAFNLARKSGRSVISVSKANALNYSGVFWDKVVDEVELDFPDVTCRRLLVDAAALHMVLDPRQFDVVVGSNLFGDILSDLGAGLVGGLGLAPSANLNPIGTFPSMFEPVHGSAPDIAGQLIANPMAAIWAAGMMVGHLGFPDWEAEIVSAIEQILLEGSVQTRDLGGTATTSEVTEAILRALSVSTLVGH